MRLLYLLFILLFTSCGIGFQYTTLNHAGHIDGIYSSKNYTVDTLNEFQVRNKLRTDFNFRYDIAQYALSQPASFDWNNRLLGNRYNWNRPYWGYSYYWDRTQMWNDWVWGYNSYNMWSPFRYDRWGYNYYGWNNYGWNSWGWNGYYGNGWGWRNQMNNYAWQHRNRPNTVRINGRRGSNNIQNRIVVNNTNRTRVVNTKPRINNSNFVIEEEGVRWYSSDKPRVINTKPRINTKPKVNNSRPTFNNNSRPSTIIRTTPSTSTRSSNTRTVRSNSRRKN